MSSNLPSLNQRTSSRWGGSRATASAPTNPGHRSRDVHSSHPVVSNPSALPATKTNSSVSDHEALQALLHSAEKSSAIQKTKRQPESTRGERRHHDIDQKRRHEHRGSNRDKDETGYYGPSLQHRRDNDHRGGDIPVVENYDDDGDRKNNKRPRYADDDKEDASSSDANVDKIKPDFGLSGALSKDAKTGNMYKGVLLKFREPPEARAPNTLWRLYVYKGDDLVETLHINKQSAYLLGRHADVCDVVLQHASCSMQHAVLQYRAVPHQSTGQLQCQPYIMDLESTNGTFLNGIQIDPARYYQLKAGDVLKFGASTREYVLLSAASTKTGVAK